MVEAKTLSSKPQKFSMKEELELRQCHQNHGSSDCGGNKWITFKRKL